MDRIHFPQYLPYYDLCIIIGLLFKYGNVYKQDYSSTDTVFFECCQKHVSRADLQDDLYFNMYNKEGKMIIENMSMSIYTILHNLISFPDKCSIVDRSQMEH